MTGTPSACCPWIVFDWRTAVYERLAFVAPYGGTNCDNDAMENPIFYVHCTRCGGLAKIEEKRKRPPLQKLDVMSA